MNASITLTGIQLTASNLPLPDVSTWFAWYYQRNIDYSAGSLVSSGDIVATTYIQDVFSTGNAYSTIDSTEISSEFSSVFGRGDAQYGIEGVALESEPGEVIASAITSISADVSIEGILLEINQGNVSASALNEEIIQLSGNPKRYAANEFKYAKVKIDGISTKISTGAVKAIGSVSISARANVQSVGIKSEVPTIYAEGVKWITEDELMTLLAA